MQKPTHTYESYHIEDIQVAISYMVHMIWSLYHMIRLNSEEPIFVLWRFFLNQIEILIQWKILNLMI